MAKNIFENIEKTHQPGGCWLWTGCIDKDGYGTFSVYSKTKSTSRRAHRAVYEALVGLIDEGLQLDHLCKIRNCVNPSHLEPVTPKENVHRSSGIAALNMKKMGCINGHMYADDNLYVSPKGSRECKECRRHSSKIYQRKRRELARAQS